jgi:MinD-like ATPase involved in chromosome partitioning or flagellar assembly
VLSTQTTIIVTGAQQSAQALSTTNQFRQVLAGENLADLQNILATSAQDATPENTIFVFSDTTSSAGMTVSLSDIIANLTSRSFEVVLLDIRGTGGPLAAKYQKIIYIRPPLSLNAILGALASSTIQGLTPDTSPLGSIQLDLPAPATIDIAPYLQSPPAVTIPSFTPPPYQPQDLEPDQLKPTNPVGSWPDATQPAQMPENPWSNPTPPQPAQMPENPWSNPTPPQPAQMPENPFTIPSESVSKGWPNPTTRPLIPDSEAPLPPFRGEPQPPGSNSQPFPNNSFNRARLGRIIAVVAPKGGTGKSFLTLNLAVTLGLHLRTENKKVLIVDANAQQADIGKYLGEYSPSIIDIFQNPASLDKRQIEKYLLEKPHLGISLLLGPPNAADAQPGSVGGLFYAKVVDVLKELFDYIIVDTQVAEPYSEMFHDFIIPKAQRLITVVTPNQVAVNNAANWLNTMTAPPAMRGGGVPASSIFWILNQASEEVDFSFSQVQANLPQYRNAGVIEDNPEIKRLANNFQIIADKPQTYPEVVHAFRQILLKITGERSLNVPGPSSNKKSKPGLGRLFRSKKK